MKIGDSKLMLYRFRYTLTMEVIEQVLQDARKRAGLSRAELSRRTGTTRAALLEYEKGIRRPRADTFLRLLDATGTTITVMLPDPSTQSGGISTLADAAARLTDDDALNWRSLVSDFMANDFVPATTRERAVMLQPAPTTSARPQWSLFVAALAEHLAFHAEMPTPEWVGADAGPATAFWWPVHGELPSQRAAAMAWSPASFRRRRILIDGRELPVVTR